LLSLASNAFADGNGASTTITDLEACMFANVNGVRLFFDVINPKLEIVEAGLREKPVLICLPGGPGGDHQTLRPFFDRFSEVAQVIYLDPRASGRSERGELSTWTLDQWGDDLAAFCDALCISKPLVLGVSGGAIVVQTYLSRHPDHAGGAILVNPCARMVKDVLVEGFGKLGGSEAAAAADAMYTIGGVEQVPAFFRHCLPHYSRTGSLGLAGAAARTTINFDVSQHFFRTGGEAFHFDHRGQLGQVACPVLMLAGVHDPVTRPEWGREVAESLPPGLGEFLLFEGSSHMIAADEPDRLYEAANRFIAAR
jgi:proline iminopeptidase